MQKKLFTNCEIKAFDDKTLTISHFISTETQDDGGDVMRADGMVVRGKPVVLFQHGQDPVKGFEPIAKPISISVGVNKDGKKGIVVTTQYYDGSKLTPPDNTGQRLFEKAKQGFMPNWSIGWEPIDFKPIAGGGREVTKWSLHEYSQVAVGMNSEATTDLKAMVDLLPAVAIKAEEEKPLPHGGESEDDFVKRCIPYVLNEGTTDKPAQAVAMCHSIWRSHHHPKTKGMDMENELDRKTSRKIAGDAIKTLHNAAIKCLKDFALKESDAEAPDSVEYAGKIMDSFHEAIYPHAVKYIESGKIIEPDHAESQGTGKGEDAYIDPDEAQSINPPKNLTEAEHKIHHKALKMAHKAMMDEMDSHKGKKDVDAKKEADAIIERHKTLAVPHAIKYIDALRKYGKEEDAEDAKKKKALVLAIDDLETKSIESRIAGDRHHAALDMIHTAMKSEMIEKAFKVDDEFDADREAESLVAEHHVLAHPHVKAFIEEVRKHYGPDMSDDAPQGATGQVIVQSPEQKKEEYLNCLNRQPNNQTKAAPAPESAPVLVIEDSPPAIVNGYSVDPELLTKMISETVKETVKSEIRKVKGKLD